MAGQSQVQIRMLHKLPLLKEHKEPQLYGLVKHPTLCQYAPKEILFNEGDVDVGRCIILCGMVSVTTTAIDDTSIPVATLRQDEFSEAFATLSERPRIANVPRTTCRDINHTEQLTNKILVIVDKKARRLSKLIEQNMASILNFPMCFYLFSRQDCASRHKFYLKRKDEEDEYEGYDMYPESN